MRGVECDVVGKCGKRCVKQKWSLVKFSLGNEIKIHQVVGLVT
jgi:hypothetical protein